MAKPKHGRCKNILPSTPPSPDPVPFLTAASPARAPGRSHAPSRTSPRFPSPAVLSALAVIATTPPVVAGGPLPLPTPPPSFLCPFIERDHSSILLALAPRADTPLSSIPTPVPTLTPPLTPTQLVADRFVQGSDDLWRKTDAWTLYGSTCCSSSTPSTSATGSHATSSATPTPSPSFNPMDFDTSVLPAGWDNQSGSSSNTESTIILALAIVLAGSICVFMIGCVIWRKRKKKARDIERKLGHKLGADNRPHDNEREKEVRGKMRMWAKATARWKSTVRQSARRRRKRPVSSIANRPLSPTFSDQPQASIIALSVLSRRGSLVFEEPDPSALDAPLHIRGIVTEPPVVSPVPPRSTSPPTYGASFPAFLDLPPSSAVSNPNSCLHSVRSNRLSPTEEEPLYTPPRDGHVATDDKSLLVRRLELASAPPTMVDAAGSIPLQLVSAPEWHEVEDSDIEDLGIDLSQVPMPFRSLGFTSPLPPPPSKVDMPFDYLDNQHHHYGGRDNLLVSDLVPGPAAPPLPSAPALDDPGLEPSAPSLEAEDDIFQDWDGTSSHVPEARDSVDLDSTMSSVSASVASHSSILPRYHP